MHEFRDELVALGFQTLITIALAAVHIGVWRQRRQAFHLSWALAWTAYAIRLGCISSFLVVRDPVWLFAHQVVSGWSALLLLWAALQFATGAKWRPALLWLGLFPIAWGWIAIFTIGDPAVAGIGSVALLSTVTLLNAAVFWRHLRRRPSVGARILAWVYTLWGLHHLDYPLLRAMGSAVLYGVLADVLCMMGIAVGVLALVLGEERRQLAKRNDELEELTRRMLRAQEEERRRIARELHDEAGQVLTMARLRLDQDGSREASELVGRALAQIRETSRQLRPAVLDRLGLEAALGSLADEITSGGLEVDFHWNVGRERLEESLEVAVYRVVQEALTNVLRHSGATRARVEVAERAAELQVRIDDDGRGPGAGLEPHLGLLGMRERTAEQGGTLSFARGPLGGVGVEAAFPLRATGAGA